MFMNTYIWYVSSYELLSPHWRSSQSHREKEAVFSSLLRYGTSNYFPLVISDSFPEVYRLLFSSCALFRSCLFPPIVVHEPCY
uniref:Uncharacterized protein n=1 Tax=Arundo donax TaxID=35708 RepID=A0A0A9CWK4_ARUDO